MIPLKGAFLMQIEKGKVPISEIKSSIASTKYTYIILQSLKSLIGISHTNSKRKLKISLKMPLKLHSLLKWEIKNTPRS
jgi:hypothetical protein